jgi:hypothetical protein
MTKNWESCMFMDTPKLRTQFSPTRENIRKISEVSTAVSFDVIYIMLFYGEDGDSSFLRNVVNIYQTACFHVTEECNIQVSLSFLIRRKIVKMSTEF